MKAQANPGLSIGGWQVLPDEGVLSKGGKTHHLEPRVMEVLVYLASRQGEVITREELERDVWRGAVIGYDAVTKTIIKLRKALNDDSREPRYIVTIPKKGYQLIAKVLELDKPSASESTASQNYSLPKIFSLLVMVAIIVVTVWLYIDWSESRPGKEHSVPSILVLPFTNMDVDKKYDPFVDGIMEDLITDLSRLTQLFVYASNTSLRYKNVAIDSKTIQQELDVDYLVKGNIRRTGDSIRINVQLVDVSTSLSVWAERYERKTSEIFTLQNELVQQFVKKLTLKISPGQQQLIDNISTSNLEAYDYFLEGQRAQRLRTRETHQLAKDLFRKAIKLDPSFGRAYGSMAVVMALEFRRGWTDSPMETLDRALALAEQAVLLDQDIPQTHWALGFVHLMRKEYRQAEKAAAKSVEISPNYADGYGLQAFINNHLGNADKALQQIIKGMKLNPYYSWDYPMNLGWANYMLGNYDKSIIALEEAQARNENVIHIKLLLAASYVSAGRQDDAEWVVEAIKVLNPGISIQHTYDTFAIADTRLKQKLVEDLKKAGLD